MDGCQRKQTFFTKMLSDLSGHRISPVLFYYPYLNFDILSFAWVRNLHHKMKGSEHTRKVINHIQLFLTSSNNFLLFLLGVGGGGRRGRGRLEGGDGRSCSVNCFTCLIYLSFPERHGTHIGKKNLGPCRKMKDVSHWMKSLLMIIIRYNVIFIYQ